VIGDGGQENSTDPRYSVQPLETAERATGRPVRDDAFREARPDSREPGNLCRASPVDIDLFARPERPGQGYRAVFVGEGGLGGECLDQLYLAGRLAGVRDHDPHRVTGDRESKQ
jgi:hypothetical protein